MLNKHNLAIAALATCEKSRYTLSGIQITPTETVVTDGHCLVRVSTPSADAANFPTTENFTPSDNFAPFLLAADAAKQIERAIPKRTIIPVLAHAAIDGANTNAGDVAMVMVTDLENHQIFSPRKQEGKFPDYKGYIPKAADATFVIHFDGVLLAKVLDMAGKFSSHPGNVITLRFTAPDSAVRIDAYNGTTDQLMQAVVMPCGAYGEDSPDAEDPDVSWELHAQRASTPAAQEGTNSVTDEGAEPSAE